MKRFCFTAPTLPLVLAIRENEAGSNQPVDQPTKSRGAIVVEMDDEENAVLAKAAVEAALCVEKSPCFLCE